MSGENGGEDRLAPVIPLFGGAESSQPGEGADAWRSTWSDGDVTRSSQRRVDADTPRESDPDENRERASEALVRKLRARPMSVAEATTFLRGHEVASEDIADIIDTFCERRYLDDALLAGHVVTSGHERKGQGRIALGRVLAQRGIPRDVADAALAELPEDDLERALEYARGKMPAMSRLEPDTAKRRLSGQLARRGYPGGVVSQVIRQVFTEQRFASGRPSSGVRFD
jgi:regulatory protein